MPALSSTMTEGKIVEWLKSPGDKVDRGESVLVVESDKADMDVEAFQEGYLGAILMPAGSTAPVGETIGLIVESKEEISNIPIQKEPQKDNVEVAKVSNEKTSTVEVNESKNLENKSDHEAPVQSRDQDDNQIDSGFINTGRIVATPRAKKLAIQLGVDLSTVRGSGPHGRVQAEDVELSKGIQNTVPWIAESDSAVKNFSESKSIEKIDSNKSKQVYVPPSPVVNRGELIPFNTLQKAVNRNMVESLSIPCFHVGYTIQMNSFEEFYKQVKPKGVTMTALLVKAIAKTLDRHPQVNSKYDDNGISFQSDINVAVAVAMEGGGLITPVLQKADSTDLYQLSSQWADLVKRSRLKQLQPQEYNSGTFTLSNLGMFGVDSFDAILPPGTGAILAVGASKPNVVSTGDGSISIKRQMKVNLTADHRIIYGADAASFLKDLTYLIENEPNTLAD